MNLERLLLFIVCWFLVIFSCSVTISRAGVSEQNTSTDSTTPRLIEHPQDINTLNPQRAEESLQSHNDISSTTSIEIAPLLKQDVIVAPSSRENENIKTELHRLIAQIRSIKFETKSQIPEAVVNVEQALKHMPDVNHVDSNLKENLHSISPPPAKEGQSRIMPEPMTSLCQPVSNQTLQILNDIQQTTADNQIREPMQLAEILFFSGHLKPAAKVYEMVFKRMDPNDQALADDRAWALFQVGNCLREDDLPEAKKIYRQLINEYPDSPWADLAGIRESLIDWFLKDKPKDLIGSKVL